MDPKLTEPVVVVPLHSRSKVHVPHFIIQSLSLSLSLSMSLSLSLLIVIHLQTRGKSLAHFYFIVNHMCDCDCHCVLVVVVPLHTSGKVTVAPVSQLVISVPVNPGQKDTDVCFWKMSAKVIITNNKSWLSVVTIEAYSKDVTWQKWNILERRRRLTLLSTKASCRHRWCKSSRSCPSGGMGRRKASSASLLTRSYKPDKSA